MEIKKHQVRPVDDTFDILGLNREQMEMLLTMTGCSFRGDFDGGNDIGNLYSQIKKALGYTFGEWGKYMLDTDRKETHGVRYTKRQS